MVGGLELRGISSVICLLATILFLAVTGSGETLISCGGVLPGGALGQSVTISIDGMFGAPMDGTGSSPTSTLLSGTAGQLYDTIGLLANASTSTVNETSTCQLSAISTNDDGTYTDLAVTWILIYGPIETIDSNGLASAGTVYQDSPTLIAASSSGFTGTVSLTVLDTLKDNYGLYAGDDIADSWQVYYFGINNSNGMAMADADQDGANTMAEFTTGTSPVNATDVFRVSSLSFQGSGSLDLVVEPAYSNRMYHLEGCIDLQNPAWFKLASTNGPPQPPHLVFTDVSLSNQMTFFRTTVEYNWQ